MSLISLSRALSRRAKSLWNCPRAQLTGSVAASRMSNLDRLWRRTEPIQDGGYWESMRRIGRTGIRRDDPEEWSALVRGARDGKVKDQRPALVVNGLVPLAGLGTGVQVLVEVAILEPTLLGKSLQALNNLLAAGIHWHDRRIRAVRRHDDQVGVLGGRMNRIRTTTSPTNTAPETEAMIHRRRYFLLGSTGPRDACGRPGCQVLPRRGTGGLSAGMLPRGAGFVGHCDVSCEVRVASLYQRGIPDSITEV